MFTPAHIFRLVFALLLLALPASADETALVKPKGLSPGDTIMIVAPAGELSRERITLATKRLRAMGFEVLLPDDIYRVRGYLAGSDEQRAAELMQAFTDPRVDAVFPGTGGYGTMRMLDLLDFEKIRANPKMLIGFSDITGLHLALNKKCNLVTFHSPSPMWGLGSSGNLHPLAAQYFWRNLLVSENQGAQGFSYEVPAHDPLGVFTKGTSGGVAEGILCGGNLSLVASLTGSEYQLETAGKILFLEDVNEAPYRVDRMLRQLQLSGQLDAPAAVLLGQFRKCDPDDSGSLSLNEVFSDYFGNASYPVVNHFPAGHVSINMTLPFGVRARVDANRLEVRVLENPVRSN